jgi:hypothetical protein
VALEAAAQVPALQAVCSASYARWQTLLEAYLGRAGLPAARARSLGNLVLSTVEGALLLSRAHADTAPLRAAGEELASMLERELGASAPAEGVAQAPEPAPRRRPTAAKARRARASR